MTKQETFDIVARHLLKQNKRSVGFNPSMCAYRGVDGTKCAVGVLIPDEIYDPTLEGSPVLVRPEALGHESEPTRVTCVGRIVQGLGHDVDLCSDLQKIHDNTLPDMWRHCLAECAERHGLTFKFGEDRIGDVE